MSEFVCPIWGTPAELLGGSLQEEGVRVSSHRAGGRYRITSEAIDAHPSLTASQRALITTWLVDQRRFGERSPTLTSKGIDAILAQRPLRYNEKKEQPAGCIAFLGRMRGAHHWPPASGFIRMMFDASFVMKPSSAQRASAGSSHMIDKT